MATNQAIEPLTLRPTHAVRRALAAGAAAAIVLALALALAIVAAHPGPSSGTAVDRAAEDALVQFRADEREETFAPSVEDIRRALIEFRASEREGR